MQWESRLSSISWLCFPLCWLYSWDPCGDPEQIQVCINLAVIMLTENRNPLTGHTRKIPCSLPWTPQEFLPIPEPIMVPGAMECTANLGAGHPHTLASVECSKSYPNVMHGERGCHMSLGALGLRKATNRWLRQ